MPLIIPPTLTKGPFFSNLSLRAQWRNAAAVLHNAQRLTVIGYSFPPADLVAQQWVGTSFEGARMDVVDRSTDRPASIRAILANARKGRDLTDENAIQRYVDRECGDHVAWRISNNDDGIGVRVSLWVNGADLLVGADRANPPWGGTEFDDAQKWIHTRVEKAGGDHPVQRAIGELSYGYLEDRHVVLAPGRQLKL